MSPFDSLVRMFGIEQMPWIIRVYLLLCIFFIILMLLPGIHFSFFSIEQAYGDKIFPIATDSLKVVIGALLGSLSMAARAQWGGPEHSPRPIPQPEKKGVKKS